MLACAAAACALSAAASDDAFDYDPKADATPPWKESEVTIPRYPGERDLLPIPSSARDTLKVYVDQTSLSRLPDGVARLSLVVESARGARNVLYEGVRCETRQYKTYAIGTSARAFEPVKGPNWQPIPYYEVNAFRYHLFKHYLCDPTHRARTPNELVQLIVRGSLGRD